MEASLAGKIQRRDSKPVACFKVVDDAAVLQQQPCHRFVTELLGQVKRRVW